MTPDAMQDALVAEIKQLFEHSRRENSLGVTRPVEVYAQDLPIREGDDEGENTDAPPEPYVLVRLNGGKIETEDSPHIATVVIIASVFDPNPNRQGYRDALHIMYEIYRRYATDGVIANRFSVQYPIEWAPQDEDTHPYYYAGLTMTVEMTAYTKEVPYT